jgi:hypothetical protein
MSFLSHVRNLIRAKDDSPTDVVAQLLLAAKEDNAFRNRILVLLRSPQTQRQSLINSALHEMALRGEPENIRAGFALLATDEGAQTALRVLNAK